MSGSPAPSRISGARPAVSPATESGGGLDGRPPLARAPRSRLLRFAAMRLALIPIQLVFVLLLLFLSIDLPVSLSVHPHLTFGQAFSQFETMVTNIFTGNWGMGPPPYNVPWSELYAQFLPNSIELALFALPIAALIAYPLSLALGWSRRPGLAAPARASTLAAALLPVFIIGTLVTYALFFAFFNTFHDLDNSGIIPTPIWFLEHYGTLPSWVVYGQITTPTGFPLVDGAIHHAWAFEEITLTKTLIQASIVAAAYVAIFLRHARSLVAGASQELHVTAARSRGIPESTLLWRHTGRRITPTLLLVFALTIPGYLVTQFVVEGVFNDPGVGFLTLTGITYGQLAPLEGLIFVLAAFILGAVVIVDLIAYRLDPRGASTR